MDPVALKYDIGSVVIHKHEGNLTDKLVGNLKCCGRKLLGTSRRFYDF